MFTLNNLLIKGLMTKVTRNNSIKISFNLLKS